MHDISDNKYLDMRNVSLQEYSIADFLHGECVLPKRKTCERIQFAIANLLSTLRFDFRLVGYNYLIMLIARYIIKHDYSETSAIRSIAESCGTIPKVVTDNIRTVIKYNPAFGKIAACALPENFEPTDDPSLTEVVETIGAMFKIYYNYTTDTEVFDEETYPSIDFNRIVFESGK